MQDKRYLSTWLSLELSAINNEWDKPYGRKRYTFYQAGDPVVDSINLTGDVAGSLYFMLKQSKQEQLLEPYLLSSTSSVKDKRNDYLGTSVCVPLLKDGTFIGLAGMDITLEAMSFIADFKPYEGATCFLISNEGVIVSHKDVEVIGKRFSAIINEDTVSLMNDIKHGKSSSWISTQSNALIAFSPLIIGESKSNWSIGTIVPMEAITASINSVLINTALISSAGLLILIISVYFISSGITRPVNAVNLRLKDLAKGHIDKTVLRSKSTDEIGEMVSSVNTLASNLSDKVNFAVDIGSGKFDTDFKPAGPEDTLGLALQTMRQNLKDFRDEDEKRKWANEGLAVLNDALRKTFSNDEEFYFNALKTMISFLQANQGGLFVIEEDENTDEKYIQLVAAYAYDRKKFVDNRISWGSTLIGQSIVEKEMVYLKQVPQNYVKITSGLGHATPSVLIIMPLKTDVEVVGAIELASFSEYKEHELDFIRKACDIIAGTIASYRNTVKTKRLLEKANRQEVEAEEKNTFFN
jgi:methyl-accepting chemotaxis protein